MTKIQVGEERVHLTYTFVSLFIIKRSQDRNSSRVGTSRQQLMQRPWRGAAYWLTPHGLLSLLPQGSQNHQPSDGTTHNGLGPSPINYCFKKMPCRFAYNLILWRLFFFFNLRIILLR